MKYVRLYGFQHKRTEAQFETCWKELQQGLPTGKDGGFLLGVSENRLLLDGVALEAGQAERSFAQLLTTAGLASIQFSNQVTMDDFAQLIRAFAAGGSKAQDVVKEIKQTFGDNKQATIRINEVKFVAADPSTDDVTVAAQIAAQSLGPEFKQWLNDPQKLLQLIAAAEGAQSGGAAGGGPRWAAFPRKAGRAAAAGAGGAGRRGARTPAAWFLWKKRKSSRPSACSPSLEKWAPTPAQIPRCCKKNSPNRPGHQSQSAATAGDSVGQYATEEKSETPLLMKAAEHMAIRFAMERFQKGEVKVNAVHQMMEHMSRQMDTLRQILKLQEDKMGKAGILVESHADILDRMFWAEVPEAGKKSVLLSNEAPCVPPRNIRQFVELLLERGDKETVAEILQNYLKCLEAKDVEPRRKTRDRHEPDGGPVCGAGD